MFHPETGQSAGMWLCADSSRFVPPRVLLLCFVPDNRSVPRPFARACRCILVRLTEFKGWARRGEFQCKSVGLTRGKPQEFYTHVEIEQMRLENERKRIQELDGFA
eukprot:2569360-Rhodomonas_salina.5